MRPAGMEAPDATPWTRSPSLTRTGAAGDGREGQRDAAAAAPSPPGLTFPPVQVPLELDPPGHDLEKLH